MKNKKSLQRSATKQDIADLKESVVDLRTKTNRNISSLRKETMEGLQEVNKKIQESKNETFEQIDGLAKLIKDQIDEFQMHKMTHQREQKQLDNHEERINNLEQATV